MPNSLQNAGCSFIVTNLLVHTTTPSISTKNLFYLPIPLVHKIILTILNNTPFLYNSAILHPNNLHQKYFPYLSHLVNSGCVKGQGSYGVL